MMIRHPVIVTLLVGAAMLVWTLFWAPPLLEPTEADEPPATVDYLSIAATVGPLLMLTVETNTRQTAALATSVSMARDDALQGIAIRDSAVATAVAAQTIRTDYLSTQVAKIVPTATP